MNELYMFAVISAWSCSPVFRRAAVDKMGEGSESTFVLLNTVFCTAMGLAVAYPMRDQMSKHATRADALGLFFVACSAALALSAGYFLTKLIADGNPGKVMATLNGFANIAGYVIGTCLYDRFTLTGVAGALMVSGGIYVLKL